MKTPEIGVFAAMRNCPVGTRPARKDEAEKRDLNSGDFVLDLERRP
jgi:hypothetical protein